jgi:hypothetical protein
MMILAADVDKVCVPFNRISQFLSAPTARQSVRAATDKLGFSPIGIKKHRQQ